MELKRASSLNTQRIDHIYQYHLDPNSNLITLRRPYRLYEYNKVDTGVPT